MESKKITRYYLCSKKGRLALFEEYKTRYIGTDEGTPYDHCIVNEGKVLYSSCHWIRSLIDLNCSEDSEKRYWIESEDALTPINSTSYPFIEVPPKVSVTEVEVKPEDVTHQEDDEWLITAALGGAYTPPPSDPLYHHPKIVARRELYEDVVSRAREGRKILDQE